MKKVKKLIGVIVSDATQELPSRLIKGIVTKAKDYDYNVAVYTTLMKDEGTKEHILGERAIYKVINYNKLDGIIFVPDSIYIEGVVTDIESNLLQCKSPVISISVNHSPFLKIPTDEVGEFKNIVNHFIKVHGFDRIDLLTGPRESRAAKKRLQGYVAALQENAIPIDSDRIYYGDFWREAGKEYVEKIVNSKNSMPQAIVCANDYMAITVCDALAEHGIRVPDDVCVSGYDNIIEAKEHTPSITTLKTAVEELGSRAVEYIYDKNENDFENTSPAIHNPVYGELILSESCGCSAMNSKANIRKERNYRYELESMKEDFNKMNLMGENLIGISTFEEFLIKLSEHMYLLKEYTDFYLCLNKNWDLLGGMDKPDAISVYTKNMDVSIAVKEREYINSYFEFPVKDMLPALNDEYEDARTFYFVPVHFKDRTFGYAVLSYKNQIEPYDYTFRSWISNVNNALEFVRVQNDLRWCYNQLDMIAVKDALTDIYNRRGFDRYAQSTLDLAKRTKNPFVLLLGDMDNLKEINDQYGHLEGDKAITQVARAFQSIEVENSVFARVGGDEFIVVFCGLYSMDDVKAYKDKIADYLMSVNGDNKESYHIDISIGIHYGIPAQDDTLNDWFIIADQNMYEEKQRKKL